jgi:predicted enzyme related to lactoylglutathione lyase
MARLPQLYRSGELVIVIDCSDLDRSARFWAAVLGYTAGRPAPGPYRSLTPEDGAGIEVLLQRVPDAKQGKNRLHLDLRTADLAAEVGRILGLGASQLTRQPVTEDGSRWHILADPDGNEFCVLQPPGRTLLPRHRLPGVSGLPAQGAGGKGTGVGAAQPGAGFTSW